MSEHQEVKLEVQNLVVLLSMMLVRVNNREIPQEKRAGKVSEVPCQNSDHMKQAKEELSQSDYQN